VDPRGRRGLECGLAARLQGGLRPLQDILPRLVAAFGGSGLHGASIARSRQARLGPRLGTAVGGERGVRRSLRGGSGQPARRGQRIPPGQGPLRGGDRLRHGQAGGFEGGSHRPGLDSLVGPRIQGLPGPEGERLCRRDHRRGEAQDDGRAEAGEGLLRRVEADTDSQDRLERGPRTVPREVRVQGDRGEDDRGLGAEGAGDGAGALSRAGADEADQGAPASPEDVAGGEREVVSREMRF